ncbi:putative RAB GDP dissociation inhibitor alpha [Trypanosoma conorhini]|uniref:Putative RAB GDP dissociation inhibitor alpha n=1 Tax=Trypanosoma conorhini TaxID=83891 RepID=A0A422PWX8_9TRYP|nr:putative RAB GDP dissociation inhibitor alpha [Trypanosoma conorhini]RNF22240.1 putative RAB GDP dissociation inhibitor alpha [Trypanosoma conorhini]
MSSDDEQGLGDLFAAGDEEAEVECPIEEIVVDRVRLSREGATNAGFAIRLECFDRESPAEAEDGAGRRLLPLHVYVRHKRHSLWGHKLWNAAKYLVKRMDGGMIDVRGKAVLELGAGLGVPSLAAFRNGARCVVVTDYPDPDLLEILDMNVQANCTADLLDADAAAFLVREAERLKLARAPDAGDERALSEAERQGALRTRCVVEPLLWGKEEHIRKVLSYTGGGGFEVVLLSDILFNHVCNDDLADTLVRVLQRSRHAAAYCVFSHHRAHKQVEDLEFFDKCVARGLRCEQVDEESYPMMFPDDRGPVEIRQPVKAYKIVRRFDDAGAALDPGNDAFDVVIQGTGMVQSMVSAALARSGVRVLHCDGEDDYGGAFKTMTVERMRAYLAGAPAAPLEVAGDSRGEEHPPRRRGVIAVDRMDELEPCERHRYLLDLLPTHYLSNGETVRQLISSDMARHMEFQRLSGFFFMLPSGEGKVRLQGVPLTRAQVFAATHVGLLQKRRLMKFVKDVEASLAEQLHARTADVGDDPLSQVALERARVAAEEAKRLFAQEAAAHPDETLSMMIERKYGISGVALDTVTLMRQLDAAPGDLLHSLELVRHVLTSIGSFGGKTPFLQPAYGSSEMPQNMCRIAAVWDATFVLRRSLLPPCRGGLRRQETGAVDSATPSIEMSNRQRVKAKVVVVPRTLARAFAASSSSASPPAPAPASTGKDGADKSHPEHHGSNEVRFSRVIVVAKTPLVSWDALRAAGCAGEAKAEAEDDDKGEEAFPPLFLALCEVRPGVVVHVQQVSAAAEQAPGDGGSVVVHFTANAWEMDAEELRQFVAGTFVRRDGEPNIADAPQLAEAAVLFLASFTVGEAEEALHGLLHPAAEEGADASETRKAHPYAVEEHRRRLRQQRQQQRQMCGGEPASGDAAPRVVPVPTLFENLIDDGAYLRAARRAYDEVVKALQLQEGGGRECVFFERLPPVPGLEA